MKKIRVLFICVVISTVTSMKSVSQTNDFTYLKLNNLNKSIMLLKSNNHVFVEALQKLVEDGDKALGEGPFTVMNKRLIAPSNDKHDYLSLAPYWWPDPDKSNGLPFIRKDGQVNPETRGDNVDYSERGRFFENLNVLSLACFFTDDHRYSEKAIQLLETWFINKETMMNPNLDYAQGVPGLNHGRPYGIIEFRGISSVITTLEILKYKGYLEPSTERSVNDWLAEYSNWLQNSELGKLERNTKNNHGTHYDAQLTGILIYLNKLDQARAILEDVKTSRISTQIEPDGSQPEELARTKSLSYSTMNLGGFIQLAKFGEICNVDLWNYETSDGRSIKNAIRYLIPFAIDPDKWKYQQISDINSQVKSTKLMIGNAGCFFNEDYFIEIGQKELEKVNGISLLTNPDIF